MDVELVPDPEVIAAFQDHQGFAAAKEVPSRCGREDHEERLSRNKRARCAPPRKRFMRMRGGDREGVAFRVLGA